MMIRRTCAMLGIGLFAAGAILAADIPTPGGEDYERSVETRLRASLLPRDWILAAEAMSSDANPDERSALISKAAAAAPDDVLVQWLATETLPREPSRARRLIAMEPDNAAHWLPLLVTQVEANDIAAVDMTLAKMAAATRFDEHHRDHLLAWADAYLRYPPVEEGPNDRLLADSVEGRLGDGPEPAFPLLSATCDPAKAGVIWAASRRENCAAIARRMVEGRTIDAQIVGYAILRRTGQNTPQDDTTHNARRWLWDQWAALVPDLISDPGYSSWWLEEWRTTGVEIEIFRHRVERGGRPTEPPPGWQPARPKPRNP